MTSSNINREWHLQHRMPPNPTPEQRAQWHIEHLEACTCRQPTPKIQELIDRYRRHEPLA